MCSRVSQPLAEDPPGKGHLSASEDRSLHGAAGSQQPPLTTAGGQLLWEGIGTGCTSSLAPRFSSETASLSPEENASIHSLHD